MIKKIKIEQGFEKKLNMIKNLIEDEKMCEKVLGGIDQNGNYIATKTDLKINGHTPAKIIIQNEYTEDKASPNYIPKSYRSQTWISRGLTKILELCGISFLQPIKWKNVVGIVALHLVALFVFFSFPLAEIKVLTVLWGKLKIIIFTDIFNRFDQMS